MVGLRTDVAVDGVGGATGEVGVVMHLLPVG